VPQRNHKDVTGTYLLKWVSPEKWREEIHFSGYTRIRVGGKNQYWQSRSTSYEVQPVLELDAALDFSEELHVLANPSAMTDLKSVKLHQRKVEGTRSNCVTLIPKEQLYAPDYCFDPGNGMLVSEKAAYDESFELSEFTPFGGKLFPGNIRIKESSDAPVTFIVNSISPLGSIDPADFQPVAGATAWPYCDNPDALPKISRQVVPHYPVNERLAHIQGAVFVYGVIGADGRLHNLKVLTAPDSGLANSAVTGLEQREYAPETCHGTPVPVETLLKVVYQLGE